MTTRALAALAAIAALALGCDDPDSRHEECSNGRCVPDTTPTPTPTDAQPDIEPDVEPDPPDAAPDASPPDAAPDAPDAEAPDAAPAPRCSAPPPVPIAPVAPLPRPAHPHPGVDALEADAYATLRDHLLADPGVHFVATHDRTTDLYRIDGGPPDARATISVQRVDHADRTVYDIVDGALEGIFPRTDPAQLTYDDLLAAQQNPAGVELPGYPPGDPRVGWLPREAQSWPDPIVRLTTLFAAADAPDLIFGRWPHAQGGTGSHGGLGHLPSRAVFIVSGRGARRGVVIDTPARLVDAAPTALAALAVPTTAGLGPDGRYDDHLYLRRQDGAVRWDALDPDPCVRPDHVIFILFDGLLATELNRHLVDDPPVELPTFRALAADGAVFSAGATVGYPSYSAPGHATAGTGAWPGHHGVVSNTFYSRADATVINPFAVLTDIASFLADPDNLWTLYDRMMTGDAETMSEALHRTRPDAYAAVLNELTVGGADYTPLDHFGVGSKASLQETRAVDTLGISMVTRLVGDSRKPVPALLQLSLITTDAAGEQTGPHSDTVRETLATMDGQLARIRSAYERRGVLDRTMWILVSDHGMELQDPAQATNTTALIRQSGVRTRHIGPASVWLATMAVAVERGGDGIRVTVTAHDTGAPIEGATVSCEGCEDAITGADGIAVMALDAMNSIEVTHPDFNPQRYLVE